MKRLHVLVAGAIAALALILGFAALAQVSQPNVNTVTSPNQNWIQAGIESRLKTYKYSSLGNTPAATPTDLVTLTGSASRTVRVTKILVGGLATTAGQLNPLIIRRSTADSGGTSTTPGSFPRDTVDAAATAVVTLYTANPASLGTTVGTLDSCRLFLQTATGGTPDICGFTYGINDDKLFVLRGVTDILAINFAGAAVPAGGIVDLDLEWAEEP